MIMKGYNIYSILNLFFSFLYTKIFHKDAKIIRLPVTIRGGQYISIGKGLVTGRYCRIDALSNKKDQIIIGKQCQINDSVHIAAIDSIVIEDNVLIASRVFITDHQHGAYSGLEQSKPNEIAVKRTLVSKAVRIKSNVWIGEGVVILPGVTIGDNAIIGANAVVTKNIASNCIACGNPAKVIKKFDNKLSKWIACP